MSLPTPKLEDRPYSAHEIEDMILALYRNVGRPETDLAHLKVKLERRRVRGGKLKPTGRILVTVTGAAVPGLRKIVELIGEF